MTGAARISRCRSALGRLLSRTRATDATSTRQPVFVKRTMQEPTSAGKNSGEVERVARQAQPERMFTFEMSSATTLETLTEAGTHIGGVLQLRAKRKARPRFCKGSFPHFIHSSCASSFVATPRMRVEKKSWLNRRKKMARCRILPLLARVHA